MDRPSLNDLVAFAAVASHRSFRAAADVMGVSRSALSHAIIGLEGKLGVLACLPPAELISQAASAGCRRPMATVPATTSLASIPMAAIG